MAGKITFSTDSTFESVSAGVEHLERFAEEQTLSPRKLYQLELIYEELMTNVVKYSFPDGGPHRIDVSLSGDASEVVLTIQNDGVEFDPREQTDPDLTVPLEQRSEGGIGIYLVRKFSRSVHYERCGSRNVLTVVL